MCVLVGSEGERGLEEDENEIRRKRRTTRRNIKRHKWRISREKQKGKEEIKLK